MTTIGTSVTLLDVAKRKDPDGKTAKIAEVLTQTNEILEDMTWMEANDGSSNISTLRKSIPAATWRLLNYGVAGSKSVTGQVTDTCGRLEARSEVDEAILDLNPDPAGFRLSEDLAHMEGMNQGVSTALIYGNTNTNPEQFFGLSPRFATPSSDDEEIGFNMIDGGGSGSDNTSVWLVGYGDSTCHGIYPKGTKAGIEHNDIGREPVRDSDGRVYYAQVSQFIWRCGLVVRDWRYLVRICNIDVSNLLSGVGAADLITAMIRATERIPSLSFAKMSFLGNRAVRSALRRQIIAKSNVNLTYDTVAGKRVMAFDGIPFRRTDAILNTETAVTGTFASE